MQTEILFCPACQGKVRIPNEMLGTLVRCPLCQAVFTAPPPPDALRPVLPAPFVERSSDRLDDEVDRGSGVIGVGVALIVVSFLSILASLFRLIASQNPDLIQNLSEAGPFGPPPPGLDLATIFFVWGMLFLVVSLVAMAGGVAMILRRNYALAVIGSIASLLNVADCCCVPANLLVGVIALIVLFMPGTKLIFDR